MKASTNNLSGSVTTIVIGAGHAGLAMSRRLTERSVDHVVLERGEVGNSWRTERWDSLRLLTPNWQNALPGLCYAGDDPDGFMTMPEIAEFVEAYADAVSAPVVTGTTVTAVRRSGSGYLVRTDRGEWQCRTVVLASGACNRPTVPAIAQALPASLHALSPMHYRNPDQLAQGGVLVVGASASGLQLAREIHRSGRPVTLAVGEHVRMPRLYRGRDVQWWMDRTGILDRRIEDEPDVARARRLPSPQLIGTPERVSLDLNALIDEGVTITGRLAGVRYGKALFSGSLRNCCALADLKLERLLDAFDRWARQSGIDDDLAPGERPAPTRIATRPPLTLDLNDGRIRTVVWATGYRPDHSWLDVPVLDRKGRLRHDRGVVRLPEGEASGLYAMGLSYMRRRRSSFISGAGDDARELADHLLVHLDERTRRDRSTVGGSLAFRGSAAAGPPRLPLRPTGPARPSDRTV